jgi:hypothetical protein
MSIIGTAYLVLVVCAFSAFIVVLFGGWVVTNLPDRKPPATAADRSSQAESPSVADKRAA